MSIENKRQVLAQLYGIHRQLDLLEIQWHKSIKAIQEQCYALENLIDGKNTAFTKLQDIPETDILFVDSDTSGHGGEYSDSSVASTNSELGTLPVNKKEPSKYQ